VLLATYLAPIWTGTQAVTPIRRPQPGGPPELIAEGFERREPVAAEVAGRPYRWLEGHLVIRSFQRAHAGEQELRARLANAQASVTALNQRGRGQRRCPDTSALRAAVGAILACYRVHGLRHVRYQTHLWERPRRCTN
jgi:hypothetical protein